MFIKTKFSMACCCDREAQILKLLLWIYVLVLKNVTITLLIAFLVNLYKWLHRSMQLMQRLCSRFLQQGSRIWHYQHILYTSTLQKYWYNMKCLNLLQESVHSHSILIPKCTVADLDPDTYVFWPPGSGSGSISQWCGSGSGSGPDPSIIKQK